MTRPTPTSSARSAPAASRRSSPSGIQEILREIEIEDFDERLAELPVEEGRAELVALPGVGRKTAACVLLFAYGKRDVQVDTHVSRVGTRLGLFREGAPFEELREHDARPHAERPKSSSST